MTDPAAQEVPYADLAPELVQMIRTLFGEYGARGVLQACQTVERQMYPLVGGKMSDWDEGDDDRWIDRTIQEAQDARSGHPHTQQRQRCPSCHQLTGDGLTPAQLVNRLNVHGYTDRLRMDRTSLQIAARRAKEYLAHYKPGDRLPYRLAQELAGMILADGEPQDDSLLGA